MPVTTPMYNSEITDIFGDYIKDGRIICSETEFTIRFKRLTRQLKLPNTSSGESKPRKKSSFMEWKTQNYESIKDEYFSNFESYSDWSEEGIKEYYRSKSLPMEKLESLIEKKKNEGKTNLKPRLMALITIKAGLIWSEMTDQEKNAFDSNNDTNYENKEVIGKKKKGRPCGYKASNYVVDSAVDNALTKNSNTEGCKDYSTDEEVELVEFVYNGSQYLKDDNGRLFTDEFVEIGTVDSKGNVVINK